MNSNNLLRPNVGYDTLHLWMPTTDQGRIIKNPTLINKGAYSSPMGSTTYIRHLKNLKLKISPQSIKIQGSISKYINNDNIILPDHKAILPMIDKLSQDLGISLREAKVSRLDVALTMKVASPPTSYFSLFLSSGILNKFIEFPGSIYLQTESETRKMAIYDKSMQADLEGNILRVEMRILGPTKNLRLKNTLTVSDLSSPEVFSHILERFRKYFGQVLGNYQQEVLLDNINTNSQLKKYCLQQMLDHTDLRINLLQSIQRRVRSKQLSSKAAVRLRQTLREFSHNLDRHQITELQDLESDAILTALRKAYFALWHSQ